MLYKIQLEYENNEKKVCLIFSSIICFPLSRGLLKKKKDEN